MQATNNSAILATIESLWEMRESSTLTASTLQKARNSGLKPSVEQHRDIYNALKAHDAAAARQAMRSHLMTVIESVLEATEAAEGIHPRVGRIFENTQHAVIGQMAPNQFPVPDATVRPLGKL